MRVVAVMQRKGGDGKSTIAAHLAGGLALRGHRVVLLDTDPQGDAARLVGLAPRDDLHGWLVDQDKLEDVLRVVAGDAWMPAGQEAVGALLLLSSSKETPKIAMQEPDVWLLRDALAGLVGAADFVVIDTAPTLAPLDAYVRLAVDGVVFVTQVEELSLAGLRDGIDELARMNEFRAANGVEQARVLGIVPNKVRANTANHRIQLQMLAQEFGGLVWTPVMLRTLFTEASNFGQLVTAYRAESYEADEVMRLVDRLLEEIA